MIIGRTKLEKWGFVPDSVNVVTTATMIVTLYEQLEDQPGVNDSNKIRTEMPRCGEYAGGVVNLKRYNLHNKIHDTIFRHSPQNRWKSHLAIKVVFQVLGRVPPTGHQKYDKCEPHCDSPDVEVGL